MGLLQLLWILVLRKDRAEVFGCWPAVQMAWSCRPGGQGEPRGRTRVRKNLISRKTHGASGSLGVGVHRSGPGLRLGRVGGWVSEELCYWILGWESEAGHRRKTCLMDSDDPRLPRWAL